MDRQNSLHTLLKVILFPSGRVNIQTEVFLWLDSESLLPQGALPRNLLQVSSLSVLIKHQSQTEVKEN